MQPAKQEPLISQPCHMYVKLPHEQAAVIANHTAPPLRRLLLPSAIITSPNLLRGGLQRTSTAGFRPSMQACMQGYGVRNKSALLVTIWPEAGRGGGEERLTPAVVCQAEVAVYMHVFT